jgi:predicted DNA-binding protein
MAETADTKVITVRLRATTKEWLDELSKQEDRTVSYLIRRIIEQAEEAAKQQNNAA